MKFGYYILQATLILTILFSSKATKLDLTTYYSDKIPIKTGSWIDLLNVRIACPNRGVFKNFVLLKVDNNRYFQFKYQCYSSLKEEADYGESIIKQVRLSTQQEWTSNSYSKTIKSLNTFPVDCWVDYGLNSFQLYLSNGIKRETICHGTKPSYSTTLSVETDRVYIEDYNSIDAMVNLLVGRTEEEDDDVVGYPLRSFKFMIDYGGNFYFVYAYAKLRNMEVVRKEYERKFEELRNSNTQQN